VRELRLPDWPFGAVGRRLLLEALLLEKQPPKGWTKNALETRAEVVAGGLDEVLAGALQLRLIEQRDGRWYRPSPLPPIGKAAQGARPGDRPGARSTHRTLPRRPYRRGGS
jgi:hypothetical protein